MTNLKYFVACFMTMLMIGCRDKVNNSELGYPADTLEANSQVDSTIYGKLIEAGMSSIMVENESGDTLLFLIEDNDKSTNLQGGLLIGDKLAIIAESSEELPFATTIINLTSLLGRWTSIAKNFNIEESGVVHSYMEAENNPYVSWKIHNGKLLLNKDTFSIVLLGPDSLLLENDKGIFEYKRANEV